MEQADVLFLEKWESKFILDKRSGYHYYAPKEDVQRVRDILAKYFEHDGVHLFPLVIGCGGCDETVDMIHYTYEQFKLYRDGQKKVD